MAFNLPQSRYPHQTLEIQIPVDEYNHRYISSADTYLPAFSTPSSAGSPFYLTQRPIDMYQHVDDPRSPWSAPAGPYDAYNNHPAAVYDPGLFSRPSPITSQCPDLPLHAPTPLSGQPSPLLFSGTEISLPPSIRNSPSNQIRFPINDHPPQLASQYEAQKPLYNSGHPPIRPAQSTFPTPSEMLSELAGNPHPPPVMGSNPPENKTETVRKARRRAMAQNIGFVPTDPCAADPAPTPMPESPLIVCPSDTISSHEKKRHYLACLEYYVQYLHEQLSLVGAQPASLQRVQLPARGMTSRSIRTLLVHMENVNRKLNEQTLAEEQRFIHLRDAISEETELQESQHQQMAFNGQH